jgi:exosome complex RNA-binding protein Csl4
LPVKIEAKGGGLTFGKSNIRDGQGKFSSVHNIRDVIGGYATAEASAAAGDAVKAQVVTKGPISLALSGKGKGVELGVAFGSFIISEAGGKH